MSLSSQPKKSYFGHVKLVGELIEDRAVAILVLLDDRGDEGDQLVPEFEVIESRLVVLAVTFGLVGINLKEIRNVYHRYRNQPFQSTQFK